MHPLRFRSTAPTVTRHLLIATTALTLAGFALPQAPEITAPGVGPLRRDCLDGAPACAELLIRNDPPATLPDGRPSPFRGFADPSLRRDPTSETLWMAYSWPRVHVLGGGLNVPSVDTHLAKSTDAGRSWRFERVLFPSTPDRDRGGSGEAGYVGHEVANLLPIVEADGTVDWIAARLDYFLPRDGGFRRRPPSSFRIVITRADHPSQLADGPPAVLASALTAPGWRADVDLTRLDRELDRCALWNEPALAGDRNQLFLALRCLAFADDRRTPDVAASDLVVFATRPSGNPARWRWRYAGRLAGGAEATELGGDGLTQLELARGRDGRLLAIVTPDRWDAARGEFVHHGCRAVEVASLDPPALARNGNGKLVVRAVVTASDLWPLGPGACGYDPASVTGILLARREKGSGSLVSSLHRTGLRP